MPLNVYTKTQIFKITYKDEGAEHMWHNMSTITVISMKKEANIQERNKVEDTSSKTWRGSIVDNRS